MTKKLCIALMPLLLALTWMTPIVWATTSDQGQALIDAAQRDDAARVLELLAAGVDINSKNRYGATALFFAAEKGNVKLVRQLLGKGAEVNVTDTFYSASPMMWALFKAADSEAHRDIALALLTAGAEAAGMALQSGAQMGDTELVQEALKTGRFDAADLRAGITAAEGAGHTELVSRLTDELAKRPDTETTVVPLEVLQGYAGEFHNEQIGLSVSITVEEGELKLQGKGQPKVTLDSTGGASFTARETSGVDLTFAGRAGLTEGFTLTQANQSYYFPRKEEEQEVSSQKAAPLPPAVRSAAAPWPAFRGNATSGNADGQGAPLKWDGATGENVVWKTPIPGIALSSPIIWGDKVFITTSVSGAQDATFRTGLYGDVDSVEDDSEHTWMVYAMDRTSGEILWQRTSSVGIPKVRRHLKSSHANPTPVTDGQHLVVHFGSEGLFTYDFEGNLLWRKDLGVLTSGWFYDASYEWGFSSSPILHNGLVIVQTDIQKGSFLAAFDVSTGEERWRTQRDEIPTWGTPNVVAAGSGQFEIVTNGPTIRGYDAATGEELWTLGPNSEVTVGSVIVSNGMAFVTGGYPPARPIYAIRPGGRGDLSLAEDQESSPHIAWRQERGGTYIPTPILYQGLLYMLHNDGRLSAHDATTGEQMYRARVGGGDSFSGSPIAADGKLYFTSEEGETFVVRAGPVYEELTRNQLGEVVMTTPAISNGTMILRGMHHVYALAEAGGDNTSSSHASPGAQ